jgi:PBP1b-binding outer membrane lipoprotein LpoB
MKKILLLAAAFLMFVGCEEKYTAQECRNVVPITTTTVEKIVKVPALNLFDTVYVDTNIEVELWNKTDNKKILWSPVTGVTLYCDSIANPDIRGCQGNIYIKIERDWSSPKLKKM